jgi:hypothetical protein
VHRQGTEQPHQGDVNRRDAIHNTTEDVSYQIRLDLNGAAMLSFGCAGGRGEHKSYHMVVEQLLGKTMEKNGEVI